MCGFLLVCTQQLKWDQLKIPTESRGFINTEENYWTGSLYECDNQCHSAQGSVCGKNQRQCCVSGQCQKRFGM